MPCAENANRKNESLVENEDLASQAICDKLLEQAKKSEVIVFVPQILVSL